MRYSLLLLCFLTFPVYAGDTCQCYPFDPAESVYLYDLEQMTSCPTCYNHDCYSYSGGNYTSNSVDICSAACVSKGLNLIVMDYGNSEYPILFANGDCSNSSQSQGDTGTGGTGTGGTGTGTGTGDGGTINPPAGDKFVLPCGYPGAQYLDCNVYDAKVEAELKKTTAAVNSTKEAVDGVKGSVNSVYQAAVGISNSVVLTTAAVKEVTAELKVQTTEMKAQTTEIKAATAEQKLQTEESKKQTIAIDKNNTQLIAVNTNLTTLDKTTKDGLKKIEDAVKHTDVKLTIGSCVEAESVYDKLPKLSGDVASDKLLTGFSCTGDQIYCTQIKLQAQSYCRDVIAQRLEAMYLNGGNVFVKCPVDREAQLSSEGTPVCHYKLGNCLKPGQHPSPGQSLPDCDLPIEVACPSKEFVPIIVSGGFSCDTKLSAGKFNADISQSQKMVEALQPDARTDALDQKTKPVVDPIIAKTGEETVNLSEAFSGGQPNLAKLGIEKPSAASSLDALVSRTPWKMTVFGYEIFNPFDFFAIFTYQVLSPFTSDVTRFLFTPISSCDINFTPIEQSLNALMHSTGFAGLSKFGTELCTIFVPFIRAFLSMMLSWRLTIYVYFAAIQLLLIVSSLGSSAAGSAGRLNNATASQLLSDTGGPV